MAILLICALLIPPAFACIGGGGGACCTPTASAPCAPSIPICQTSSYGPVPQPVAVPPPPVAPQPCLPTTSGCGAGGSYAAPQSFGYGASYAAPALPSYAAAPPAPSGYAVQAVSGYAASYPRPVSSSYQGYSQSANVGYASGNVAPVVRKVITVQKTLPESKFLVQEAEKPQTIDIIEPQPVAEVVEKPYPSEPTPEVIQVQTEAETPAAVPIVVLPMSTATAAPAVQPTQGRDVVPAVEPVAPPANEYQASIDNAYEEIASEEEALKKQEKLPEPVKENNEIDISGSPTIPPAIRETYGVPEAPAPAPVSAPAPPAELAPEPAPAQAQAEAQEPIATVASEETNEEILATSKEPESKPVTLSETYQPYKEATVGPVPPGLEQPLAGIEQEQNQRVDVPASSSQSGEYIEDNNAPEEPNTEPDGGACNSPELRAIVENALRSQTDNLEAARQIEGDASKKFGGRFNAIVSDAEFAYVNWYGKMNCQLKVGSRHSLTWED